MARAVLKAAADTFTVERLKELTLDSKQLAKITEKEGLRFDDKEIAKMPKAFRREFRTQGCTAHIRKRKSGPYNYNYEIRYRRNGYNISVSSNNLEEAKNKFIAKLTEVERSGRKSSMQTVPTQFGAFAEYFFEKFYKRKVTAITLRNTLNRYNNHIKPTFGEMQIKNVIPQQCQNLVDKLTDEGKGKTADEVFSILNAIFQMAVKHNLIMTNPMDVVYHIKHETTHGTALSKEEEKQLLNLTAGTPYQLMFAVALYTGLRPNEYETAKIVGQFIVAVNSKRKNKKIEYKKIPITPKLKPYLEGVEELKFYVVNRIREKFHTIFPERKIYDMRTTFYTRCCECGVADVARSEFVGHSLGKLGDAYTDLSDEFLIKEGNKLNY